MTEPTEARYRFRLLAGTILLAAAFVAVGLATFDEWSSLVKALLGVA